MNAQLPRFWSRYNDDLAAAPLDALQQDWSNEVLWINPPYALLPRILNRILQFKVTQATILAPLWPSQAWFPVLLGMTLEVFRLGSVDQCHYAPTVSHQHQVQSWQVAAFRVSFQVCNSRDTISELASVLFQNGKMEMANLP
jgi:hypothetical protein